VTLAAFEQHLTTEELDIWKGLDSPFEVQAFLDTLPYSAERANRSPLRVVRERLAHCLDGALFAAAGLRRLGYPPVIVQMLPVPGADDDHIVAIYKRHGCFGAVGKSNFVGLRFREAVYRTVRELVLSYFEGYFNSRGEKTLRDYTMPLNLEPLDKIHWMWNDAGADAIEQRLTTLRRFPLISPDMASALAPMDRRSYRAGMLGTIEAGLYKPKT
jgi:hypothetical protein